MRNGTTWIVIVIIILAALGAWWYMSSRVPAPQANAPEVAGEDERFSEGTDKGGEGVESVTVNYSSTGFSPKTLTVPVGTRVTFVNEGAGEMWVASDEHPTHAGYSGTERESHCPDPGGIAFDQCGNGPLFTFVFTKEGNWTYHNHRMPEHAGTIVVVN